MGKRTSKEKWERNFYKHKLIQDTASYGVDLQKQSTKPDVRILKQAWTTMDLASYMNQSKKIYNYEL